MKKKYKMCSLITVLFFVIMLLGMISVVNAEVSSAQAKVETFTENTLPIDKSQYNITLDGYYVSYPPSIKDRELNNYKQEHYRYSAVSDKSELSISYTVENGFLTTCVVNVKKGAVLTDQPYSNLNDAVTSFLEKYQSYKNVDNTEMRSMLQNTDLLKNQTLISGDLKLQITNGDYPFSGHTTSFMWYRTINGCDYLELSLGFNDGTLTGLKDVRELYPIGDATVNISKDQAISIALKYVSENYTYEMPGNIWINNFNVVEKNVTATLSPTVRESNRQYPIWSIWLPLDHTYPGSVVALQVSVSAASGEVLLCGNQATGGNSELITDSNSTTESTNLPSSSAVENTSPSSIESNKVPLDLGTVTVIAGVVAAVAVATIALVLKKRSK